MSVRVKLPCGVIVRTVGKVKGVAQAKNKPDEPVVEFEYNGRLSDTSVAWDVENRDGHSLLIPTYMTQNTFLSNIPPFIKFLREVYRQAHAKPARKKK